MKNVIKQLALYTFILWTALACSKKDDVQKIKPDYALKGTFTMKTNKSSDPTVLLFENNKVFHAYEAGSIHQTLAVGGNLKNESAPFTLDAMTKEVRFILGGKEWFGLYNPETGEISNGGIRDAKTHAASGYFSATKQIQKNEGLGLLKGHWKGLYSSGNATPNYNYSLIIEDNSISVIVGNKNILEESSTSAYGLSLNSPVIQNNTITAIYEYIGGGTYSVRATYNPDTKKLEGTWGVGTNYADGGKIVLESQNN